ncbi:MAG: type II secretion system protein M [Deltaproteobacteria bacterium]|nr:type II secretion system protein M [Deltaproteobacteria bacterium]
MDKIKSALADAMQYLEAASPRERRLVMLTGVALVAFILIITWGGMNSAMRRRQDALDEKREAFEKIQKLAGNFGAREQERQMMEARLRQSPPQLMSFVDNLAKQEGVDVGGMSDRGVVSGGAGGKPKESSVEVNLGRVPLEKLTKLLAAIEHTPGVVRVRRLRVRKSLDNKDTLDVSITISAWQGA